MCIRDRLEIAKCFVSIVSGECLTGPLSELMDYSLLSEADGSPHIPKGYYYMVTEEFFTGSQGKWIIAIPDLIIRQLHPERSRLNGCCGLDGCDGPNLVDSKGNAIGTEKSDCWMPHCIILEPTMVRIEECEQVSTPNDR